MKYWTVPEVQRVKYMASQGYTKSEVADALGRSESSVHSIASRNGLRFSLARSWADAEVEYLRATAGRLPVYAIAAQLGRSHAAVRIRASKLGLSLK